MIMSLRLRPFPTQFSQLKSSSHPHYHRKHAFSSCSIRPAAAKDPTLYEILDVPVTASTPEIKKYISLAFS